MIKNMSISESGAHHCTRENISYTIKHLEDLAAGREDIMLQDWVAMTSVLALQMKWLLSAIDES